MNKISAVVTGLVVVGGALYFYMHESLPSSQSPLSCSAAVDAAKCQSATPHFQSAHSSSSNQKPNHSASSHHASASSLTSGPHEENLKSTVTQKYAILFSLLQMSEQTQHSLQSLLLKREQVLSSQFYDARSNEAEIAANLGKRAEDVAAIDRNIEALLSEADVKKYHLLKDSTYEQAQMNGFYELAGAENNLPAENKERLLLAKLEQKQFTINLVDSASGNIKNAALSTRPYLIEKMHQRLIDEKETYLHNAKALLNEDQFNVLRDYEQQLFDERWKDITAGFATE
jgi:hypothetical protein